MTLPKEAMARYNRTLFISQNSNHFFAVVWYCVFVPSRHELKIMSIVSAENPLTCNFVLIHDK